MFQVSKIVAGAVFILATVQGIAVAEAGSSLGASRVISAPPGFAQACSKYTWLCKPSAPRTTNAGVDLTVLAQVNRSVNASIRPLDDRLNYGQIEFWTLPTNGSGDCEDYALLKKKRLIESGVPSSALALAVVLDRKGNNHVVLLARAASGDLVLDNLTSSIKSWSSTGYTFLARQSFENKRTWKVALAGPRAQQVARSQTKDLTRPSAATGTFSFLDGR